MAVYSEGAKHNQCNRHLFVLLLFYHLHLVWDKIKEETNFFTIDLFAFGGHLIF